MILQTKEFKQACAKILSAIDTSGGSDIMELVELSTVGDTLYLNVTNNEYYVSVLFNLNQPEEFHATVNASLFLKLISQITTEELELNLKDTYVQVKANGTYKIPLIYCDDKMMSLDRIDILNPTVEMPMDTEILRSILSYNVKELQKGVISNEAIQKLHYVDDQGAVTFTTGACVNSFTLPKKIQILLNNKIVKLFKLFDSETVDFTLGYDALSEEIIQTKIKISSSEIVLTAILNCDNYLLKAVPVDKIRARANNIYPYTVQVSKNSLSQAISRLLLLIMPSKNKVADPSRFKPVGKFTFKNGKLTLYDINGENSEDVIVSNFPEDAEYTAIFDLNDMKLTLDTCIEPYLSLSFGDGHAGVISRLNILNVIPECEIAQVM